MLTENEAREQFWQMSESPDSLCEHYVEIIVLLEEILTQWKEQGFHESHGDFDELAEKIRPFVEPLSKGS